jgi:hypothetical protein
MGCAVLLLLCVCVCVCVLVGMIDKMRVKLRDCVIPLTNALISSCMTQTHLLISHSPNHSATNPTSPSSISSLVKWIILPLSCSHIIPPPFLPPSLPNSTHLFIRMIAIAGATVSSIAVFDTQKLVAVYRGGQVQFPSPPLGRQAQDPSAGWTDSQETSADLTLHMPLPSSPSAPASPYSPLTPGSSKAGVGGVGRPVCAASTSASAPVSGIAFSEDRITGSLLITTDKHIISLPLDPVQQPVLQGVSQTKKKQSSAWDKRSIVRIDFGTPIDMNRDPESGLLFMTLKAPGGRGDLLGDTPPPKKAPGVSVNEGNRGMLADCVALVSASHTAAHPLKISMSPAQLYREHAGAVSGVISCTLCDRVASFDDQGCLLIWRSSKDRVRNLKASSTIASTASPLHSTIRNTSSSNPLHSPSQALRFRTSTGNEDTVAEDIDEATRYENILTKKKFKNPAGEKKEKYTNVYERRARGLVKDFEMAARADPSAWCTSPIWSPPSTVIKDPGGSHVEWPGVGVRTSISATFTSIRVDGQKDNSFTGGGWRRSGVTSPGPNPDSDDDREDREDRGDGVGMGDSGNVMASLYSPCKSYGDYDDEPNQHEDSVGEEEGNELDEVRWRSVTFLFLACYFILLPFSILTFPLSFNFFLTLSPFPSSLTSSLYLSLSSYLSHSLTCYVV